MRDDEHAVSAPLAPAVRPARPLAVPRRRLAAAIAAPAVLYAAALAVHLWVAGQISFPFNEGSAYYVAAARSLVEGRGLVVDALWSYATPPLVLPRPAFELWQPLASLLMAPAMAVLGTSFAAAQITYAALGALVAPLGWQIAREAGVAVGLEQRRVEVLAIGSAVLVVVLAPLLAMTALPDSALPFTLAALAACWLLARVLTGGVGASAAPMTAFGLGVALGVAWLARQEAIYLGLATVLLAASTGRLSMRRLLLPVGAGGLLVTVPWLVRNALTFGTPLTGQGLENMLFTHNEQVFAYASRPSLEAFLGQGLAGVVGNIAAGTAHNLATVLLVSAVPVGAVGIVAAGWLWRRRLNVRHTALGGLLLSGGLTFAATSLLFPVATLWGTFQHATGPLLVGLTVAAVLGGDRLVQAIGRRRAWQRSNAWLVSFALLTIALPVALLQVGTLAAEARRQATAVAVLAQAIAAQPEADADERRPIIADHPVWLSEATDLPAIALPAEPLDSLLALARRFDARLIAITAPRGDYPALLRSDAAARCFSERGANADTTTPALPIGAAIFAIAEECR